MKLSLVYCMFLVAVIAVAGHIVVLVQYLVSWDSNQECVLTRAQADPAVEAVIVRDHDQLHCWKSVTDDGIIYVCPEEEQP
jgi:hypothetical protein